MATKASRSAARLMMAPAVVLLLGWMLVPLIMTLWFSFRTYLPLRGGDQGWTGFDNYVRFVTSSAFWPAVQTTLIIVLGVLIITVVLGVLLAMLLDRSFRSSLALFRGRTGQLAVRRSHAIDHHDRQLAMAALRDADPADGDPVA